MGMLEAVILTVITAATPLLLAAIGELVTERSGVLNLGVEGMMVMGAMAGFAGAYMSGSLIVGLALAIVAGVVMSLLFAFLTLTLVTNQVATGLSLTILGLGLSGILGEGFVSKPGIKMPKLEIPGLTDIPFIGPILFGQDALVYFSILLTVAVWWFLFKTRAGLVLRAVGDNHDSAHGLGYNVIRIRYLAVMFGGGCAGLGGAYLSLAYTPLWTDDMTAGRGWIALALVVFGTWMPGRVVVGAYLFGFMTILGFHAQALGYGIPSQFLSSLPYLATIVVLVLISMRKSLVSIHTPACIGKPFVPSH